MCPREARDALPHRVARGRVTRPEEESLGVRLVVGEVPRIEARPDALLVVLREDLRRQRALLHEASGQTFDGGDGVALAQIEGPADDHRHLGLRGLPGGDLGAEEKRRQVADSHGGRYSNVNVTAGTGVPRAVARAPRPTRCRPLRRCGASGNHDGAVLAFGLRIVEQRQAGDADPQSPTQQSQQQWHGQEILRLASKQDDADGDGPEARHDEPDGRLRTSKRARPRQLDTGAAGRNEDGGLELGRARRGELVQTREHAQRTRCRAVSDARNLDAVRVVETTWPEDDLHLGAVVVELWGRRWQRRAMFRRPWRDRRRLRGRGDCRRRRVGRRGGRALAVVADAVPFAVGVLRALGARGRHRDARGEQETSSAQQASLHRHSRRTSGSGLEVVTAEHARRPCWCEGPTGCLSRSSPGNVRRQCPEC